MKLLSNNIIYIGSIIGNRGVNFLMFSYFTKLFSTEQIGQLEIIYAIFAIGCLLGTLQVESALVRFYNEFKGEELEHLVSTIFFIIVYVSSFVGVLFFIISYIFFNFYDFSLNADSILAINYSFINIVFYALFTFFITVIRYEEKPIKFLFFNVLQASLFLLIFVGLTCFQFGLEIIWKSLLASNLISVTCLIFLNFNILSKGPFLFYGKKVLSFSLPMMPGTLIGWSNSYLNRFVILKYLSLSELGMFSAINRISALILFSDMAIRVIWQPFFWKSINLEDHKRTITEYFNKLTFYITIGFLLFCFLDDILVGFLIAESYWGLIPVLGVLNISFVITIFINMINMGPDLVKRTIITSITSLVTIILNLGILLILLPIFQIYAIPYSILISNILSFSIIFLISEKLYTIGFNASYLLKMFGVCLTFVSIEYYCNFNYSIKILILIFLIILSRYIYRNLRN